LINTFAHSAFSNSWYILDIDNNLIKIKGVTFNYILIDSNNITHNFTIDHEAIIKAILKDVKTGNIRFIKHNTKN